MDARIAAEWPPGVPPPPPPPSEPASIIVCTLGMLPSLSGDGGDAITTLLVDEAGAAWAGCAYFIDHFLPSLRRLHLFGDDRQLPPNIGGMTGDAAASLARQRSIASLYDAAGRCGHAQHALRVQYRMPSPLADFLSAHMYAGVVASAPHCDVECDEHSVVWLDCPAGGAARNAASGSWFNLDEVEAAVALMDAIDSGAPVGESRVVITPYRDQRDALEAAAGDRAACFGGAWSIFTVDSFQGREAQARRCIVLQL